MNNQHRIVTINRFCDEFESQLKSGEASTCDRVFEAAKQELKDEELLQSLLSELIALEIAYSDNFEVAADAIRLRFPQHESSIAEALRQRSLLGTVGDTVDSTDASNGYRRPIRSIPDALIANVGSRFENLKYHASGGLGDVYIGFDKAVCRNVAVKLLKPSLVSNEQAKGRFLNEGAITAMLEHPGIVPIYDSGVTEDGQPYYAMRLLEGQTLQAAIRDLHSPSGKENYAERQRDLLRAMTQVCDAVSYSHDHNVIHRDLKPANMLRGKYGETMVIDWGLARKTGAEPSPGMEAEFDSPEYSSEVAALPASPIVTAMGRVVGTPAYMSPEQGLGDSSKVGKQSDVYSLGSTLYCILTGKSPTDGAALVTQEVIETIQTGNFPTAKERNAAVPESLSAICERAMQCDPDLRYESAKALASDIENWLEDQPVVARPDSVVEKISRFIRKHRRWSVAALTTLVAVAIGSSVATAVISAQSEELAQRKIEAEAQTIVQTELATENEELAERERVTGLRLRERLAVLRSYIRLAIQEDGDFSKGKLRELILDRVGRFKNSASLDPANLMRHVDTGVFSLSLITEHDAALEMYQEFADLRESLDDGKLASRVHAVVEEAQLLTAAGKRGQATELLEIEKARAIDGLGVNHEATQALLRNLVYGLRGEDNILAQQEAICLLYPWLPEADLNGVPNTLTIEGLSINGVYATNLCVLGEVEKASLVYSAINEAAADKFGATEVHVLESHQYHAEDMEKYGTLEQALATHRLLAIRLAEEYGDGSPRSLLIKMQLVRLLLRSASYSEAVEMVELIKSFASGQRVLRKNELLFLDVLHAKSLLLSGRRDEAVAILDDVFEKRKSLLRFAKHESSKKLFELAKIESAQLEQVIDRIEKGVVESRPKWNPYLPLTVPYN